MDFPAGDTPSLFALIIYGLWELLKVLRARRPAPVVVNQCQDPRTCLQMIHEQNQSLLTDEERKTMIEGVMLARSIEAQTEDSLRLQRKSYEYLIEMGAKHAKDSTKP